MISDDIKTFPVKTLKIFFKIWQFIRTLAGVSDQSKNLWVMQRETSTLLRNYLGQ